MASNKAALKRLAATATEQTIRSLVEQLTIGPAKERASAALKLGAIAESGVKMKKPSEAAKASGAIIATTPAVVVLVTHGAITPLVALVAGGTDEGKIAAAACLAAIASYHPEQQDAIAKGGGVGPLVALLRGGTPKAQLQAAAAVASLSEREDLRRPILKSSSMPALVRLLKTGTDDHKVCAATCIANLADRHPDGQNRAAAEGAVPLLVSMLGSGKVQTPAAAALSKLAANNPPVREAIAKQEGLVPLLALLNGVHVPAQAHAAAALAELAKGDEDSQTAIAKAGGIRPLVAMLQTRSSTHSLAESARALAEIARSHAENKEGIKRVGALKHLVGLLSSDYDHEVQAMASLAITEICRVHHANQNATAALGVLDHLVQILRSHVDTTVGGASTSTLFDVKAEAAGAVWALVEDHDENKALFSDVPIGVVARESVLIALLVNLLATGSTRAQSHAAKALAALGFGMPNILTIIAEKLVGLLGSGNVSHASPDAPDGGVSIPSATSKGSPRTLELVQRAAGLLNTLLAQNPTEQHVIATAGKAADLVRLLRFGCSDEARSYAVWSLSLSIDSSNQQLVIDHGGVGALVAATTPFTDASRHAVSMSDLPMHEQIGIALRAKSERVIHLFREWDVDGDGKVSCAEFRLACMQMGIAADTHAGRRDVNRLFDSVRQPVSILRPLARPIPVLPALPAHPEVDGSTMCSAVGSG